MITSEQWCRLMGVSGLFARQNLFVLLTADALLGPPGGEHPVPVTALPWLSSLWAALICMHTAFLTEHSTQARKAGKKGERNGNKILFLW